MILSTTYELEGKEIAEYLGLVFGETVHGINVIKDLGAGLRNIVGGRSAGYEEEVIEGREEILSELSTRASNIGADAVVGIKFNYVAMGQGNMLMVSAVGTAVKLK